MDKVHQHQNRNFLQAWGASGSDSVIGTATGDGPGDGLGVTAWSLFLSSGGGASVLTPSTGKLATSVPPTLRVN